MPVLQHTLFHYWPGMISLQILAHATAARLSCHVQNFVVISPWEFGPEKNDLAVPFELWWKMCQWNRSLFRQGASSYTGSWWRHQLETFSALLTLYAGNSPVTGEFPALRPVTRGFDVFVHLYLNKRFSKQSWSWWLKTPSRSLWRRFNGSGFLVAPGSDLRQTAEELIGRWY